jgi:hypothetical protein
MEKTNLRGLTKKHLTMDEIDRCFRGYWVIILNEDSNEYGQILGGEVWYYSKSKVSLCKYYDRLGDVSSTHIYVGDLEDAGALFLL